MERVVRRSCQRVSDSDGCDQVDRVSHIDERLSKARVSVVDEGKTTCQRKIVQSKRRLDLILKRTCRGVIGLTNCKCMLNSDRQRSDAFEQRLMHGIDRKEIYYLSPLNQGIS